MEVLLVLIGIAIGGLGVFIMTLYRSVGTLRIDQSDMSEEPYLFLELDKSVEFIMRKKRIHLRVNKQNFISENK